jgi:hypothetical protein
VLCLRAKDGDLLVLNARFTGVALKKETGDLVWMGEQYESIIEEEGILYKGEWATPVFYDYGDRRCALIFSCPGL